MNAPSQRFGISTWSDVVALGSLLLLGVGVITWGMKLEARIDANTKEIAELKSQVGNGILPRAEERIRALEREMDQHTDHE